jgi:hypothetical protein
VNGVAADATLSPDGRRAGHCPLNPAPVHCEGRRKTVYRLGVRASR